MRITSKLACRSRRHLFQAFLDSHQITVRSKLPSVSHLRKGIPGKSWKAEHRRSVEEGEVLEDAVGIGVVDDAILL